MLSRTDDDVKVTIAGGKSDCVRAFALQFKRINGERTLVAVWEKHKSGDVRIPLKREDILTRERLKKWLCTANMLGSCDLQESLRR